MKYKTNTTLRKKAAPWKGENNKFKINQRIEKTRTKRIKTKENKQQLMKEPKLTEPTRKEQKKWT